ncbi:MAG: MarR family winged helix-turn-helix transcriptional regulator [Propionibacteriaceae bacterium]
MSPETVNDSAVSALSTLIMAGERYRQAVAAHFGLGVSEAQAISHLTQAGELGMAELAGRLSMSTGAATSLVDRLERSDLARRHSHPRDRRRSVVRLTPMGYQVVAASRRWFSHAFDEIPADKVDEASTVLVSLAINLSATVGQIPARAARLEHVGNPSGSE